MWLSPLDRIQLVASLEPMLPTDGHDVYGDGSAIPPWSLVIKLLLENTSLDEEVLSLIVGPAGL